MGVFSNMNKTPGKNSMAPISQRGSELHPSQALIEM
jgi:hypothetical protein